MTPGELEKYRAQIDMYRRYGVNKPDDLQEILRQERQENEQKQAAPAQLGMIWGVVDVAEPETVNTPRPTVEDVCHVQGVSIPEPPAPTPDQVEIWPRMGLKTIQDHNTGGAWRLWVFAHAIDPKGSGAVTRDDLQTFCTHWSLPRGTFRRWLARARRLGLFREVTRQNGGVRVLVLAGAIKAARILGCNQGSDLDNLKAKIPVQWLIGEGWKSHVWTAFIATLKGQPASRETLRKLTGIPERTQREYERITLVKSLPVYAHDESRGDGHLAGVREFERKHAFIWRDRNLDKDIIAWRLPDIRTAPEGYNLARKGRIRKIRRGLDGLVNHGAGQRTTNPLRIFHGDHKHAQAAQRRYNQADIPPWDERAISEFYYKKPGGKLCQQMSVLSV